MKRPIHAVAVAIVACALLSGAGGTYPHGKSVRLGKSLVARYDKFKDNTAVATKFEWMEAGRTHLSLVAAFSCTGDSLSYPDTVGIVISYAGQEWMFLNEYERGLVFLLDGDRVPVKILLHNTDVSPGLYTRANVSEQMVAMIPSALAARILASAGEGQIGNTEFRFGKKVAAGASEMAALLTKLRPAESDSSTTR